MADEDKAVIHLEGKANPTVLAGMLDMSVATVYNGRLSNMFPSDVNATYRQCLIHYARYLRQKAVQKSSSLAEAVAAEQLKLTSANVEMRLLEIKEKKQELIDIQELLNLFEPVFSGMRATLTALTRKHPELTTDINNALNELADAGKEVAERAHADMDNYIQEKLSTEFEFYEQNDYVAGRVGDNDAKLMEQDDDSELY
jgi:phage terminase Nu1 subunit (DNA packaging protein)